MVFVFAPKIDKIDDTQLVGLIVLTILFVFYLLRQAYVSRPRRCGFCSHFGFMAVLIWRTDQRRKQEVRYCASCGKRNSGPEEAPFHLKALEAADKP